MPPFDTPYYIKKSDFWGGKSENFHFDAPKVMLQGHFWGGKQELGVLEDLHDLFAIAVAEDDDAARVRHGFRAELRRLFMEVGVNRGRVRRARGEVHDCG